MEATERRERLIRILMMYGQITEKELAERLEVSERTISRDVEILSRSKPISTISGRNGGVYILNTYEMRKVYMKEYEITLLKKIVFNAESSSVCLLTSSEIQLLKEMITFYSAPKYEK